MQKDRQTGKSAVRPEGYRVEQRATSVALVTPSPVRITPAERLVELRRYLDKSITFSNLARLDWRRQTDVVQEAFIVAALFADLGNNAVFVDGHINDFLKRDALSAPGGVKRFFNRRCHDAGFAYRRLVLFDTVTTRKMGRRGSGRDKLHIHGAFELPLGWSKQALKRRLAKVFGNAGSMGDRQFHISSPRWDQHYSHNGVQVAGPFGKVMYAIAHAGSTYRSLDLNEGKRSRSSPPSRGACNRKATGLARGIPSNFNADIVFTDHVSKRAGKVAFELWVKAEKGKRTAQDNQKPTRQTPATTTTMDTEVKSRRA